MAILRLSLGINLKTEKYALLLLSFYFVINYNYMYIFDIYIIFNVILLIVYSNK